MSHAPDRGLKVVVVGPVPPPVHGVAMAVKWILDSPHLRDGIELIHLDTSDRRTLENLGRVDLQNIAIGIKNLGGMFAVGLRHRPQLVYYTLSQNAPALLRDVALFWAARLFGCRAVVHLAGSRYYDLAAERTLTGLLIRHALRRAAMVLVLGESQVEKARGISGHQRVHVVPNGLPDTEVPRREEGSRGECSFLYLGALRRAKGVGIAIQALALARMANRDVRCTFAGAWPNDAERAEIAALVEELGVADTISFPGLVDGQVKEALFAEADAYLAPSFAEGQPVSILEAMRAGLPVLATTVGAIPDTVEHGVTGRLVQPGDVESLAKCICSLADDPRMRSVTGRAGRERFEESFTLARSHEQLREAFNVAAGLKRGPTNA